MKLIHVLMMVVAGALAAGIMRTDTYAAESADIVIYGGTSSGVIAAVQARRMGKSVVLIEPSNHIGGMTTGGLGATDIGNKAAIGGRAREFYHRVWQYYQNDSAWTRETRRQYASHNLRRSLDETMWTFEPHVAMKIYREMLAEASVKPVMNERLDRRHGVKKTGGRIESITMESGRVFAGQMFIDGTYEGDLMAAAGVSFVVGREANSVYGETLNGVEPKLNVKSHRFLRPVDPYVKPGDANSGLLPGIQVTKLPPDGSGDRAVQAYCFRLCTTDVPENRRAWPKPRDYDPLRYELLLRNFEAGDGRAPWAPVWMPNRKTDTNNNGAFSTDYIGGNYQYPTADYATRERIVADHRSYTEGLMWTLANDPRVPAGVRAEFNRLGLAKDEFVDNDNWPTQLYVREARRMVGMYVMTEHNCRGTKLAEDSIGLGAYGMDSHNCQRYVAFNEGDGTEGGGQSPFAPQTAQKGTVPGRAWHVQNEGDVEVHGFKPYPISYRAIVPGRGARRGTGGGGQSPFAPQTAQKGTVPDGFECENLLVPVCLSSSHIAYGSIRMEPVFMILGQSAATAAATAIDDRVPVQRVDYAHLRQRLLADGQRLEWGK
ncbi:MAG TPA: FAD-dependent oxidoreductase [Lacipirellulaceae bacterium]|nr:FAD-dependent oxidoreductase [Lacipirellulaceae bacterium]